MYVYIYINTYIYMYVYIHMDLFVSYLYLLYTTQVSVHEGQFIPRLTTTLHVVSALLTLGVCPNITERSESPPQLVTSWV